MACLKKMFIKDRGSWTPAAVQYKQNESGERGRHTMIDCESARAPTFDVNSKQVKIKQVNFKAHPNVQAKVIIKQTTDTTHINKRRAPKHPKDDPRNFRTSKIEKSDKKLSVSVVSPENYSKARSSKPRLDNIKIPTYLKELKEKQSVLLEKKSRVDSLSSQRKANYEDCMPAHVAGEILTMSSKTNKKESKRNSETTHNEEQSLSDRSEDVASITTKQKERDSGVHIEENGLKNNEPADAENSTCESDDLNPPTHSEKRKEGLIFTRPKVSKETEKVIKVFEKDEKTRNLIRNAIEANDFLNNYMDKERKELVIDAMEQAVYEKDSFIIRENEEGSEIYVSDEGVFDVIKNNEIINTFGAGNVFGELAILYNAKRFASIKASSKAIVWKIERTIFRTIMVISGSKEREENLNFLRSVPLLKDLPEEVLLRVVDLLKRVFFPSNTCIVRQGNVGNDFYIIRGGFVTIKKNVAGDEKVVGRRKRGEYFGEQALLNEDRRTASVYADPPGTECLKLDRVSFKFGATASPSNNAAKGEEVSEDKPAASQFSFGKVNSTTDGNAPKSGLIFGNALEKTTQKDSKIGSVSFKTSQATAESSSSKSSIFSSASSTSGETTVPKVTGFSFTAGKPFTFGSNVVSTPAEPSVKDNEEAEEDDPPKVEFTPVVEEDSVYSKRCKVFVKHDGNYADCGVGTLYLKPVKDTEKTQLLVRADTNLGNILLNFILNESIPAKRLGKNNVMMVCIPTPEAEQTPTSILLRVKTGEKADELLSTINKHKK